MDHLLKILEQNARFTNEELGVMLNLSPEAIADKIEHYENIGAIKGYKAIIDLDKLGEEQVYALIELKVTPKRDHGFDEIAHRIVEYPEVENLYLMSGGYDLAVMISGRTFKDIALFVSQRLSQLDSVLSTATHFILTRYKDKGVVFEDKQEDERGNITL